MRSKTIKAGRQMNRLFHSTLSPFCRKVRLTLAEKKIEVELIEDRYWEQQPDFLRRNPAGKVPVLRLDGTVLSVSQAICELLEERNPSPPLLPHSAEVRYEVRRLCSWFDDKFHHEVTSKLLYERVHKKMTGQGYPDSRNVKLGAQKIKYHLDYIGWLLDQRRWLAGDAMTLAYRKARNDAINETDLRKSAFPESCPYAFDDVTGRPVPFE